MADTITHRPPAHSTSDERSPHDVAAYLVAALILVPPVVTLYYYFGKLNEQVWLMLCAAILLSLFLPILAHSYYFYRQQRKRIEVTRIFEKLDLPPESTYEQMFRTARSGPYFCLAAGIAWVISLIGLMILFMGESMGIDAIPPTGISHQKFPIPGSRLVFGMAFLGAYFWGLQYLLRRYVSNDLIPGVFYGLALRMPLAATLALLVFNAFASFTGGAGMGDGGAGIGDTGTGIGHAGGNDVGTAGPAVTTAANGTPTGVDARIWPALAFLLGAFPQRAQQWLVSKIPGFSTETDPAVRPLPLEMIEGLRTYDRMRLEELGIDSCHDLAVADFIPLILRTSYGAREVTDWILQAKLCVYCGQSVKDLRTHGIRTIVDLIDLEAEDIAELAKKTSASDFGLIRAHEFAKKDEEIKRLRTVAGKLSQFTQVE